MIERARGELELRKALDSEDDECDMAHHFKASHLSSQIKAWEWVLSKLDVSGRGPHYDGQWQRVTASGSGRVTWERWSTLHDAWLIQQHGPEDIRGKRE